MGKGCFLHPQQVRVIRALWGEGVQSASGPLQWHLHLESELQVTCDQRWRASWLGILVSYDGYEVGAG